MLKTPLCDLFGVDVPIILAPMGSCTSAELAAAVSNQGGLGGIGTLFRTTAAIKRDIEAVKGLTNRHYAINHIPQMLHAEAFRCTLEARPRVISFALGDPGDLIKQVHDVGSLVMLQVTTVAQAVAAAERGVDAIIAGVNLGTRFITSDEAPVSDEWKQAIARAKSEDAIKADVLNDIVPLPGTAGFGTVLRSLRTPFLVEWNANREKARRERDRLREHVVSTHQAGRQHATLLTAGQTAGGIKEILPLAEIMRRLIVETEAALAGAPALVKAA